MPSSASSGRIVLGLAALLVIGAVGVVFYSVGRWKSTFSGSIVAVQSPEPLSPPAPAAYSETESATPFLLDQPSASATTTPRDTAASGTIDVKKLRVDLEKAGMDPALLKQVSDQQLLELYSQFVAQTGSAENSKSQAPNNK